MTLKNDFTGKKDKVDSTEKKGVVYRLNCAECDVTYIGQTGQCLKSRMYRHMLALKNKDVDHYPLVEHVEKSGHLITLNGEE